MLSRMGILVPRWLVHWLTGFALLLATAALAPALAMPSPDGAAVPSVIGARCADCAAKSPAGQCGAKLIACSPLACAGITLALPLPAGWHKMPMQPRVYTEAVLTRLPGIAPAPDPFPPKPISLG
jgi:hypothetical protein